MSKERKVSAIVYTLSDHTVFIQRRALDKGLFGGKYEPLTEKKDPQDINIIETAKRGLQEEQGITPDNLKYIGMVRFEDEYNLFDGYIFVTTTTQPIIPCPIETIPKDSRYRTISEIEQIIQEGQATRPLELSFQRVKKRLEKMLQ